MSNVEGFFCVTCGKDVPHNHTHVGKLLPPFHKPMCLPMQCHLANDRIAQLETELQTAKNAYDQLAGIHHRTNAEWKKDVVRARAAESLLSDLRSRFDEHVQSSTGDRKHTWMDALRYVGASPTKSPSAPDCDNCPQPHDEYNEPDCDACDADWTNEGGTN